MQTQRISLINLNNDLLQKEVNIISQLPVSDIYDEFVCGGNLRSCMLWNKTGSIRDNALFTHDSEA